jgi:hypothetical protein
MKSPIRLCDRRLLAIASGLLPTAFGCATEVPQDEDSGSSISITITAGETDSDDDGDSAEGSATDSAESNGASGASQSGGDGELPKFDVGSPDGAEVCMGTNSAGANFSYIWVANSPENTISKINTQTLVEEGRYQTRDSYGNPSRTSVALSGHVAVANRSGGVTKYLAYGCAPGPTSSGGAGSDLPFGEDGCLAWSTNMPYGTQRPVAWAPGVFNNTECRWENELLWTSGAQPGQDGTLDVLRLDGETGMIVDTVNIPDVSPGSYGAYGGASDGDGNFWISQLGVGSLVRIDAVTLDYEVYPMPISGYGMAVDPSGRPWVCGGGGVARFNLATKTFDVADANATGGTAAGCMTDNQFIWLAGADNVRGIDLATMQLVHNHPIDSYIHGTSVDFDGYVWGVSRDTRAYKVDPVTGAVETVDGLNSPYTYSDMTGFGLSNAGSPEG